MTASQYRSALRSYYNLIGRMRNEQFERMCYIEANRLQEVLDNTRQAYLLKNVTYGGGDWRINVLEDGDKIIDQIGAFRIFPVPHVLVVVSKIQLLRNIDHHDMFLSAAVALDPFVSMGSNSIPGKLVQLGYTNSVALLMNPMCIIDDLTRRRKKLELTQRENSIKKLQAVPGRENSYWEHSTKLQQANSDGDRPETYGEALSREAWTGYSNRN